jgi:hypothetical protein
MTTKSNKTTAKKPVQKRQNTTLRKKAMIKALQKHLGIVSHAGEEVGIDRTTHYRWLNEDEEYKKEVEEVTEAVYDGVESVLLDKVYNGSTPELLFFMKCKMKKRGYIEKEDNHIVQNITISDMSTEDIEQKKKALREKLG